MAFHCVFGVAHMMSPDPTIPDWTIAEIKVDRGAYGNLRSKAFPFTLSTAEEFSFNGRVMAGRFSNRPTPAAPVTPVTLLHRISGTFIDDCKIQTPAEADNHLVLLLRDYLSEVWTDETERLTKFRRILAGNGVGTRPSAADQADGDIASMDILLSFSEEILSLALEVLSLSPKDWAATHSS
jgi:hypothetical protein